MQCEHKQRDTCRSLRFWKSPLLIYSSSWCTYTHFFHLVLCFTVYRRLRKAHIRQLKGGVDGTRPANVTGRVPSNHTFELSNISLASSAILFIEHLVFNSFESATNIRQAIYTRIYRYIVYIVHITHFPNANFIRMRSTSYLWWKVIYLNYFVKYSINIYDVKSVTRIRLTNLAQRNFAEM